MNDTIVVHPHMPLAEMAELLRRLSTDTHEAFLEVFATATGIACAVRFTHRNNIAPEFTRLQGHLNPYHSEH
ncbi:hypothetical protein UFOVP821_17 [uncultured Caudovirales phage]|uniref:Uncharacterized protein n=1 Tax=uncultured Caudovirales phage TaxID=2100421 RepID=A0A6J5P7D8_9CAUD|nr:hypothetical protein UFOVP821_17 [uncultured Caudovirales phage]